MPTTTPDEGRPRRSAGAAATPWVMLALVLGLVLALARPAAAHPLGLPAFATVSSTGDRVVLTWSAAPDDVAALARWLDQDAPVAGSLTRAQDAALAASPALQAYLSERMAVRQGGAACPGTYRSGSVVLEGITGTFTCPIEAVEVEVTLSLLADIDARYRTIAAASVAGGVTRVAFTAEAPTSTMVLEPGAGVPRPDGPTGAEAFETAGDGTGQVTGLGGSLPFEAAVLGLLDGPLGPGALLVGLALAFAVGAAHGLAPGHGKAIAGAYLVGDRGRRIEAVKVGAVVALMHTASVLALGIAVSRALDRGLAERAGGWLQVIAGVAVTGTALVMLRARLRPGDPDGHGHVHGPGGHHHEHDAPRPVSAAGILALGAGGGLLPSPTALLVVLTGLATGRTGLALGLVAMFSLGLAATITVAGLAVIGGRDLLRDSGAAWAAAASRRLPVIGAAGAVGLGLVLAWRGAAIL